MNAHIDAQGKIEAHPPSAWTGLGIVVIAGVLLLVIIGGASVVLLQKSLTRSQDIRNQAAGEAGPQVLDGCVIGGCSGELCTDPTAEGGGLVSNCMYQEKFSCYQQSTSVCRKLDEGKCGWAPTEELQACLTRGGVTSSPAEVSPVPVVTTAGGTASSAAGVAANTTVSSAVITCATDSDCETGQTCYQPPMPKCPEGLLCAQVMPAKQCVDQKIEATPPLTASPSALPLYACTEEAKICPDGSSVGRTGPNCAFAPCPGEEVTTDKAGTEASPSPQIYTLGGVQNPTQAALTDSNTKLGDLNHDGRVNLSDYTLLIQNFLKNDAPATADLDHDGIVNILDYSLLIQHWSI